MRFKFLNVPVYIHPTFWIFFLLFTRLYSGISIESFILGAVLIVSLLVHEYGHALTAEYFGAKSEITLEGFGGYASYNSFGMSLKQLFLITLNGPLFESILIFIPYYLIETGVFAGHYYVQFLLYATMKLNILWCLFNLIPVAPLDGGKMLGYFLEGRFGEKGRQLSFRIGIFAAVLCAAYLFYLGYFFFGGLLLFFGFQSYQRAKFSFRRSNPFQDYNQAIMALRDEDLEAAKSLLGKLVKSRDKYYRDLATEALAKVYVQEGAGDKAYGLLIKAEVGKCLLCKLAFERKNYALVCKYANVCFETEPTYEVALRISKAFAFLGQPMHAGAWLETAAKFQKVDVALLDQIYDAVRNQEAFKQYAEKNH